MGITNDTKLVEELCEIEEGMSDWEVDFVEGIAKQVLDDRKPLSPKQTQVALKIRREYC